MSDPRIPAEELTRIHQDAQKIFPRWGKNHEQSRLYEVYVMAAHTEWIRTHSSQPTGQLSPEEEDEIKSSLDLIAKERYEQIHKHGRTLESDRKINANGELCWAASMLLYTPDQESSMELLGGTALANWDQDILKRMNAKPYRERLIIAGALIAAEIDRLGPEESPLQPIKEPVVEMEKRYSRPELFQIVGHWSHDMLSSVQIKSMSVLDWSDLFNNWFEREYPSSATPPVVQKATNTEVALEKVLNAQHTVGETPEEIIRWVEEYAKNKFPTQASPSLENEQVMRRYRCKDHMLLMYRHLQPGYNHAIELLAGDNRQLQAQLFAKEKELAALETKVKELQEWHYSHL